MNQTTRQALDGLRRPVTTTFADNASVSQAWNQLDQLTGVTDSKGVTRKIQFIQKTVVEQGTDEGDTSMCADILPRFLLQLHDLLEHIAKRGMFPSPSVRFCTR